MALRRSFRMEWLKNKAGEICGLNLGADYCAEHEWGIDALKSLLGIDDSNPSGLESRRIKTLPEENVFILDEVKKKKTGKTILMIEGRYVIAGVKADLKSMDSRIKPYAPRGTQPDLATSWGKGGLCVIASKEEDKQNLRVLISALKAGDVALWLGGGGVFQNSGLCLGIISKVDEESKEHMKAADEDKRKLTEAVSKTGIVETLKEAGRGYFALSPAWTTTIKSTARGEMKTAHEVIFFLNPMEQTKYNHGWFSVEDLTAWAKGEGPILKSAS